MDVDDNRGAEKRWPRLAVGRRHRMPGGGVRLAHPHQRSRSDPLAGGECCKTEFANNEWWLASFSLVVPIVLAARQSRLAGFAAAGVSAAAVWLIPVTIVNRYDDARKGDGPEGLTYVYAGLQILCFLVCAIVGARRR